ncbi:unnamed protein product [Rotaria sp. Silwood2]|nr:unnamed protein product [Rotaria sp. Silwood2]
MRKSDLPMARSNQRLNYYDIVCDCLFSLDSWTYEQKSRLLDVIVDWTSQFQNLNPIQLQHNLRYLLEILTHDVVISAMVIAEKVLETIETSVIPPIFWLDYLLMTVSPESTCQDQDSMSFDSPLVQTTVVENLPDFESSSLVNSDSFVQERCYHTQHNSKIIRPSLKDIYMTPSLSPCELFSRKITTSISPAQVDEPLELYRELLAQNVDELFQFKWDHRAIESLKNIFRSPQINNKLSSLKTALLVIETIVNNQIFISSHVERIVKTINTLPVEQWMKELNTIVAEQGKAKSVETLLKEIVFESENSCVNIIELEQHYRKVMHHYETETSQWTINDIQRQTFDNDDLYKIAIIIQAVSLHTEHRPRDIQILSLLILIGNPKVKRRLAQIRTGEGKSIIVAMCKY